MSEALYKFLILIVVMATRIHARMNEEKDDMQEQLKILQNTVKELQDTVYIQTIRSDQLEEKLVESENDVQEMKELLGDEMKKLEVRISRLESIKGYGDQTSAVTKPGRQNNEREISRIKSRLGRLERKQNLVMDNRQALRNPSSMANYSRETKVSENTRQPNVALAHGIQSRLLSSLSPSNAGVAFYAYMSKGVTFNMNQVFVFDVVKTNVGSAYHPTTGLFIAPQTGVYVFTWTFRISGDRAHSIKLLINQDEIGSIFLHTAEGVGVEDTGIVVTHVNAGDDVFVRTHSTFPTTGHYISSDEYGRSSFAGWRIF